MYERKANFMIFDSWFLNAWGGNTECYYYHYYSIINLCCRSTEQLQPGISQGPTMLGIVPIQKDGPCPLAVIHPLFGPPCYFYSSKEKEKGSFLIWILTLPAELVFLFQCVQSTYSHFISNRFPLIEFIAPSSDGLLEYELWSPYFVIFLTLISMSWFRFKSHKGKS